MAGVDIARITARAAKTALNLAGTAKTTGILHLGKTQVYDPVLDQTVGSAGSDVTVEGLKYDLKETQGEGPTSFSTMFMLAAADAPAGIDEADSITIEGSMWNIVDVRSVPGKAIYQLGLRR